MEARGVLLSCLIHLLVIWGLWSNRDLQEPATESDHADRLAFVAVLNAATPLEASPSPVPVMESPTPEPPVVTQPAKPVPVPPVPAARVEKSVPEQKPSVSQRSPEPQRMSEPAPAPVSAVEPVRPKPVTGPVTPAPAAAPEKTMPVATAESKPVTTSTSRLSYVRRLTQRIEQYKTYPRRARERGISDEVHFSINIDAKGELQAFHWVSGNQVFRRATLQSVRRALPYPPDPGLAPVSIQIRMIYSLQDRM